MNKHASANLKAEKIVGGVATDQRHDSAHKHVSGSAVYIDDMPEPAGTLHGCLGLATATHATIAKMDLSGQPPAIDFRRFCHCPPP
ncbi:xanthine dehydrogenase molybdopterin binding subunit, partial [Mesorhizobium sp. B263B1A]|nr:xanthine dehydrogenase molybdopterin binding subunit [Mesorhizobium sp. B263B1A]